MTLPNWNPEDYLVDFPDIVIIEGTPILEVPFIYKVSYVMKYLHAMFMRF